MYQDQVPRTRKGKLKIQKKQRLKDTYKLNPSNGKKLSLVNKIYKNFLMSMIAKKVKNHRNTKMSCVNFKKQDVK
jgi:hypothetical protein